MDIKAAEEFLDQLFSSLESLETRSAAVLQFLKQQNGATDEQLAPYFQQAGNASNVRWRAARLRLMSLLSAAMKDAEPAEKPATKSQSEPSAAQAAGQPIGARKESSDQKPAAQGESEHSKRPSPESASPEQTEAKARSLNQQHESRSEQKPDDEKTPPDPSTAASQKHETSEAEPSKREPSQPAPSKPSKKDAA
jgi:hypothetical protein